MPEKNPKDVVLVVPPGAIIHAVWRRKAAEDDPEARPFIAGLRLYRRAKTPPGQPYDGNASLPVRFDTITRIDAAEAMAQRNYVILFRLANPDAKAKRSYDLELLFLDQRGTSLKFKTDEKDLLDFEDSFKGAVEIICLLNVEIGAGA